MVLFSDLLIFPENHNLAFTLFSEVDFFNIIELINSIERTAFLLNSLTFPKFPCRSYHEFP